MAEGLQAHGQVQETSPRVYEGIEKIFPTILIALDFLAAIPYAVKCDLKMTVYWIAAGVLTFSVTWM